MTALRKASSAGDDDMLASVLRQAAGIWSGIRAGACARDALLFWEQLRTHTLHPIICADRSAGAATGTETENTENEDCFLTFLAPLAVLSGETI
jgi:hypothetical protein